MEELVACLIDLIEIIKELETVDRYSVTTNEQKESLDAIIKKLETLANIE